MLSDDISNINPGEQLREFLKSLYPLDSPENSDEDKGTFIFKIDESFMADGAFAQIVYESSINYLLRRLINTAEYLRKKYSSDEFPPEKFTNELRTFIKENTKIDENDIEKILSILQKCLEARDKKTKGSMKRKVQRAAEKVYGDLRCYICGKSLSSTRGEIEIEHIFPRHMGGATEEFNLKVSCKYCNSTKNDHINFNDFHYEKICLVSERGERSFEIEMKRQYKIAIWAKNQYKCAVCEKEASEVGRLEFVRINLNDSWHFLNI
jgi:hypothetical protein